MENFITRITERLNTGCFKITPDLQVSEDGSTLIWGHPVEECALIFTKQDDRWVFQQELTASDATTSDYFGWSISISYDGSTAIVGAFNKSATTGAAYVFTRSGSTWVQQQKLTASDGAAGDGFGGSVCISSDGSTAIVGAYYGDPSGKTNAGATYIFTRSESTWTQQQKLTSSDAAANDFFGISVSISSDGSTAIVGAYGKSTNAGATYIFTRSESTWTQQQKLTASDGATDDFFGNSVSISSDGSTVIVGAPGKTYSTGAAYVFTRSGSTWAQQQKLTASDAAGGDDFGCLGDISGDGQVIEISNIRGKQYTFTLVGDVWVDATSQ